MQTAFPNAWTPEPEARNRLFVNQAEDLSIFGKTTRLLFGKNLSAIDNHLIDTAAAGNQFNICIRTKGAT